MKENINDTYFIPADSYSRKIDRAVQASEMPYGYRNDPPSADTGDFDQAQYETKKEYKPGSFRK